MSLSNKGKGVHLELSALIACITLACFDKAQLTLFFNLEWGSFGDGECLSAIMQECMYGRRKTGVATKKKGAKLLFLIFRLF